MSIEENRARYEGTTLQALMDSAGHSICTRCYCCEKVTESDSCWQCGGFAEDEDDEWGGVCSVCHGEGQLFYLECLGRCDENGDHEAKPATQL